MKQVFSVLMMILSLLIGFQQAIIVMHFKLNQEAIEQEFCINKNKPELQCHGTCHLKKRLQETENTNPSSISTYQKVDMLPISVIEFKADNPAIEIRGNTSIYQEVLYMEPCREIFVPPPIIDLWALAHSEWSLNQKSQLNQKLKNYSNEDINKIFLAVRGLIGIGIL